MASSYYSVVLDHSAAAVWAVIRPFDHYGWAGVPGETVIEAGRAGDQVGAVRCFFGGDRTIRQVLLAHSDRDRAYTYAFADAPPFPVREYIATIRVRPVTDGDRAFVEWSATFDCLDGDVDRWSRYFAEEGFAKWLGGLRAFMAGI
jgi:hypothetical protein